MEVEAWMLTGVSNKDVSLTPKCKKTVNLSINGFLK
jgi:hypothetical protein